LGLDIQCGAERAGSFWQHKRQKVPTRSAISEQLFLALQRHAQLQRVELFGGWAFSEAVITNFVDEHNDTLRCLILSDPLLFGSWQSALAAIAVAMYNKAEFIKARMPMESESIDAWPLRTPDVKRQVFLGFSCPYEWVTEQQRQEYEGFIQQ
jgi:hypothetical protein